MKTFILFWNPAISSYKLDDFQRELEEMTDGYNNMNWSIWEHEKAHAGDRFFMVRCGEGKTGICMSGYFTTDPYEGEDWSGRGRKTYYMDLEPDVMIHPEYLPVLTTIELMNEIQTFDWTGGHSGRLLDEKSAEKLESLWKAFTERNEDIFKIRAFRQDVDPSYYVTPTDNTITCYLSLTSNGEVNVYNHRFEIDQACNTIDEAKQFAFEKLQNQEINNTKVVFMFDNIENENQELFSKVFEKFLSLSIPNGYYELIEDEFNEDSLFTLYLYCLVKYGGEIITSLLKQSFPQGAKDALKALVQLEGESDEKYLKRVGDNELATSIKLDILEKELNINNLDKISIEDLPRLNKALKVKHWLENNANAIIRD